MTLTIHPFSPADEAEAMELATRLAAHTGLAIAPGRGGYARRAEAFEDAEILVAREGGRLVGTAAIAFKDLVIRGRPVRGAYVFDLRVHPDHLRKGVATELDRALAEMAQGRADLRYTWVAQGQAAEAAMTSRGWSLQPGGCEVLVAPAEDRGEPAVTVRPVSPDEVFASHLAAHPPLDLCPPPGAALAPGGEGSWLLEEDDAVAGLSARAVRGVQVERADHLLPDLGSLARFASWGPLAALNLPQLPRPGEEVRSWLLHDLHSSHPAMVAELVRLGLTEAHRAGAHVCQFLLDTGEPLVDAVAAELDGPFLTRLRYRLFVQPPMVSPLRRVYLDVRDL